MSNVKRFRPTVLLKPVTAMQSYTVAQMEESAGGKYVLVSAYDALAATLREVRGHLEKGSRNTGDPFTHCINLIDASLCAKKEST